MRRYWNAFVMCQSMFCAFPCPWKAWDEKARPIQLLFLPIVGLEIGVVWAVLAWLTTSLELQSLIRGIVLCAYPFLATGFIHLDGFMDVSDAVKSWRDLERRREILKDSRVGAFSVINVVLVILAQFAFATSVPFETGKIYFVILALIPVVSRCCAGLAVTGLPAISSSQYAGLDRKKKVHLMIFSIMLVIVAVAGVVLCGKISVALAGVAAGYALALRRAYKSLEGMNGDISGYALTIGEMCGLAVLALI